MAKEAKRETFEESYGGLEDRVGKLEAGGLSLEEAIALYEEGMTLAKHCQELLDRAEQKITKLKESFAALAPRTNGAAPPAAEEHEYVADEGPADDADDDPFG